MDDLMGFVFPKVALFQFVPIVLKMQTIWALDSDQDAYFAPTKSGVLGKRTIYFLVYFYMNI